MRGLALILCLTLPGCATIAEQWRLPPVTRTTDYADGDHPMLVQNAGAELYAAPDRKSRLITVLPAGAVVWATGEAGSETQVAFYHTRSRSGNEGWCERWDVEPSTNDVVELSILRDRQAFEKALQDTIFSAASRHIATQSIHPASRIEGMWVVAGKDSVSSTTSHDVQVRTIMVGNILGRNKFQVDLNVNLFVALNRDHMSASTVEANRVTVLKDEATTQMPVKEAVDLLKLVFGVIP